MTPVLYDSNPLQAFGTLFSFYHSEKSKHGLPMKQMTSNMLSNEARLY